MKRSLSSMMTYRLPGWWRNLTAPVASENQDEARQEHMTKAVLVMMEAALLLFTLPIVLGWITGLFEAEAPFIMLLLNLPALGGWWLAQRGYWRWSSCIPPLVFFSLALYLTSQSGLVTSGVLFYGMAILLTAMLQGNRAQWRMLALSLTAYLIGGWIYGDRSVELVAATAITIGGAFTGIALLQWFFTNQLERALALARLQEKALRNSKEQLDLVIDGVPAMIAYVDANERYLHVNKAYSDWYRRPRADFIGTRIEDLLDQAVYQRASPYYKAVLSGEQVSFENVVYDKDGRECFVSVNLVPHFDDRGSTKAFFALIQDITERKQADKAREELIGELQAALAKVKTLSGLLPICASCKKIRDDKGYWHEVEVYMRDHSEADFSHSICPACAKRLYPDFYQEDL